MTLYRAIVETEMPSDVNANNILYADIPAAGSLSVTEILDLWAEYVNNAWAEIAPHISDVITLLRIIVYVVDTVDGKGTLIGETTSSFTGTNPSAMNAHGVSFKVNFKVPLRARPASLYLPAMGVNNMLDQGLFNSPSVLAVLAFGDDIRDPFVGTGGEALNPVYWSQKNKVAYPLSEASVVVNNVPDYQRRRKPGVGS